MAQHVIYIVGQLSKTKTAVGILRGQYRRSSEALSGSDGQFIEITEVGNDRSEATKQTLKDAHQVLQDPNQTEVVISEKTTVPMCAEIGFTYFVGATSRLRLRGSLSKTHHGHTETRNGRHSVHIDGSVRLFVLIGVVHVFVLTGTVTIDIDCTLANVSKEMMMPKTGELAADCRSSASSESVVSARSLHKRMAENYKRRTTQMAVYLLGGGQTAHADMSQLYFVGYCLGKVCRHEIIRDSYRFPLLPAASPPPTAQSPFQSTIFVVANPLDKKIQTDIRSLDGKNTKIVILGSEQARIVLFSIIGSGIMLEGYWSVIGPTRKVLLIKGPKNEEAVDLDAGGQITVKLLRGNAHCVLDLECTFLVMDSDALFSVDRHFSAPEENMVGAVAI